VRHTVAMTLLSNSQTDRDASLEPASVTKSGSAHSMSGVAAIGGFGVGPIGSSSSQTSAAVDSSSRRSLKQRRRSSNVIRAPIASAEQLSPTSPQGFTPSGSDDPDVHRLPVDTKSLNDRKSDMEFAAPQREQAAPAAKTKTPHISTSANSKDDIPPKSVAVSGASQPELSASKPASELGKTSSFCPSVSDASQSYVVDNSLPASLPPLPGAVRRPHSFVHAMSDQLVLTTEPRRGRGAQSPILETQPEEELSSIFEFSV